jgi:hypothetical protein
MEENNNPFYNSDNDNKQPDSSDTPAVDNGQSQSEHTGYEQPGYQNPQDQPLPNNQQGYPENNQEQYGQQGYQQNYSQDQQYDQNPYGYNQYNQNPYGQNQYQYQEPKGSNAMAVASLVCGIVGLLISCCAFISLPLSITSIVLGIIVLKKNKEGRSLAIIGIIIGAATVLICFILIAFSAFMINGNSEFSNYYREFYNQIYNDAESSVY